MKENNYRPIVKSLIKWLYVIILPGVVTATAVYYFYTFGWNGWAILTLWIIALAIIWFNSLFFMMHMSKTNLLPKITATFAPVCGFAMGLDRYREAGYSWIILLPFISIEFKSHK